MELIVAGAWDTLGKIIHVPFPLRKERLVANNVRSLHGLFSLIKISPRDPWMCAVGGDWVVRHGDIAKVDTIVGPRL